METVRLMVEVKPYSFDNEPINYEVMRGSLESIDSNTSKYQNEEVWFRSMKEKILTEIQRKRRQMGQFVPNDIELLRVYILKEEMKNPVLHKEDFLNISVWEQPKIETEIRPLFQEIKVRHQFVFLEDIIKNRMFHGNLEMFYRLTYELGDYAEFFKEVPEYLKQKIITSVDEFTINEVYTYFSKHQRFMALVRILLLNHSTFKQMGDEYLKCFGELHENTSDEANKLERIRMPYKED